MTARIFLAMMMVVPAWGEHGGTERFEQRSRELRENWGGKVRYERLEAKWSEDGASLFYPRQDTDGWWVVDLASGRKETAEAPPEAVADEGRGEDRRRRGERRRGEDRERGVKSPDEGWFARVEGGGAVLLRDAGGHERRIEIARPEGWVLDERVLWSPRSDRFVVWRRPNHEIREVHYVRSSPDDQLQPKHFTNRYPKPGDALNVSRPVVCYLDERAPLPLDESLVENPYEINKVRWREDGKRLTCEFIERGFGRYAVIEIDSEEREQRSVVEESSETFVNVYHKCFRRDLKDGAEVLWLSERDGWNHLYLMDGAKGGVIAQLTKGEWVVRGVERVDEDRGEALIRISGYHGGQDPYWIHWARIGLGGGELARGELVLLTEGAGTHRIWFSPDREHYVDTWSRVDCPPVHELRRTSDGALVSPLEMADAGALEGEGWIAPERFSCQDRNGRFEIYGIIHRPPGFDPARKYPVIEKIYAGPHDSFVPKGWRTWYGSASEMAAAGFIVVQIDGLGTSNRCREFHHFCYRNLMDSGFPDRIKWMQEAATDRPEMDLSRVGIFGGSAGGQSTLAALLNHGEFYQAGVADCGCHDNRMDKIWWNEQWMDWPVGPHYAENSNVTHAGKLQGALLLTVGEVDTNVDPSSTLQVVDALIKADKDFEFFLVPNANHGVGESPYLRRQRVEFFQRHLGAPR